MATFWFVFLAGMLAVYVLLDGFDMGVGALHLFVAKNDAERRLCLRAIGPVWDGNEVWLIAAGGTLFFAFPALYAASFSGFYLPLIMVLWLLMLRGAAIELRSHLPNVLWSAFWDGVFGLSSALLALLQGVALANVMRGVPLDASRFFFEPLWTTFDPLSQEPGILDWYTVLIGLLTLAALTVHGGAWLAYKLEGEVQERARELVGRAWLVVLVLTAGGTTATFGLRPTLLAHFQSALWGAALPLLALAGLIGVRWFSARQRDGAAFLSSGAFLLGLLGATAFAVYPEVLPAVNPAYSLTVQNAATSDAGLWVGFSWWLLALPLAIIYFVVTYRLFWGKVQTTAGGGY